MKITANNFSRVNSGKYAGFGIITTAERVDGVITSTTTWVMPIIADMLQEDIDANGFAEYAHNVKAS